jgi:hypothetical protein
VSATAKVRPVAVLAFPALGDQFTETLAETPPSGEVTADIDYRLIMQEALSGLTPKAGSEATLLVPLIVKSAEPELVDLVMVGLVGQPPTVKVNEVFAKTRGAPPVSALANSETQVFKTKLVTKPMLANFALKFIVLETDTYSTREITE